MKRTIVSAVIAATALGVVAVALAAGSSTATPTPAAQPAAAHAHAAHTTTAASASDLRALLGRLFGEHAALAMNATNQGVTGSPSFKATAAALDRNSVALSKAIGSVYGAKAAKTFLDGKFMWRDHIRFFVDYTVALAKKDRAAQNRAVANLQRYTVVFGDFLAGATGLPKLAVRNDLLGHVLELKRQLDQFASRKYAAAAKTYSAAYAHMFATADLVAGAIAKQKKLR
jgi:hypothetical protein